MQNPPLRIAFGAMGGAGWTAGVTYFRNLFVALKSIEKTRPVQICFVTAAGTEPDAFLKSYIDEVLYAPKGPDNIWVRARLRLEKRLGISLSGEPSISVFLRQQRIDAVFTHEEYGPKFRVPLLSWIPDFQHLRLPQMFSPDELRLRNEQYLAIARHATRVILSSRAAEEDLKGFAPLALVRTRVLPFVAHVPAQLHGEDPAAICDQYHLPRRFIYLPNQFWKHKNHTTVVEALALAKTRCPEIAVACTGNTNDYRNLNYFGELLMKVSRLGVRNHLLLLGMLPHAHLYQLMRQSVAVLQPSLFEGWSTTVEEVKSIGKRIILSDIPVHREQNPPACEFFDPGDAPGLADCLVRAFLESPPGSDLAMEARAREALPGRMRSFGQAFVDIVEQASREGAK